jgi:acyl-homoserine-lactone acylase
MKVCWTHRCRHTACHPLPRSSARARSARLGQGLAAWAAISVLAACTSAAAQPAAIRQLGAPQYQAAIVRTAYGIPHITAHNFGSLGYGYGFSLASDDLCTMADGYVTVEGQRSRYFGPSATVNAQSPVTNLESDIFWRSVVASRTIPRLLTIRTGPGAIGAQLRQLIGGYVAGYNRYLASVGGSARVPDPTCRGKAWVKPITSLDAYLRIYQAVDQEGQAGAIDGIAGAQPPASASATGNATTRSARHAAARGPATAELTSAAPLAPPALSLHAASAVRTPPGADGLLSMRQLRELGKQSSAASQSGGMGSNAIAIGSVGTRDHEHGMLLGNPHYTWDGIDRFYEVQLTIPGTMNVEGATLSGIPLVLIGFTSSMAWSLTVSTANTVTPYQLTLVPGHPTQYVYDGRPVTMTSQTVIVDESAAGGAIEPVSHTLWFTRWGPVINRMQGQPLPWTTQTAFALDDANAGNFRFLNHLLATDEAGSVTAELRILKEYQGLPYVNTVAADSSGHTLFADIQATPDVTDAEAARCDTALGAVSFQQLGLPVLDGSRSSCAWGTNPDSAAPGIFGPAEEPALTTKDFVENSNNSYWLANPAHPLTGFPRIIGETGTDLGLRARNALTMVMQRISGTDGLGPPGFTFQDMKNLMFSEIQYGASLVKSQLVTMCNAFPGGLAPTSSGGTMAVADSCSVLAAWNGRDDTDSPGAVLFRDFWLHALHMPNGPWSHPFSASDPVNTPYGLDAHRTSVRQAFGDALADLAGAHLPYNAELRTVQYVVRNGKNIPLPGGPDGLGDFNVIDQNALQNPGADPLIGSSYIQDVTWTSGDSCPEAASLLTYSQSANPDSPHYADQTGLFSLSQWVTAYFCPAQVTAHAISAMVLSSK